ncbi:MAG: S8 family serine peptidase [Xanthobacteraceae bacterium]
MSDAALIMRADLDGLTRPPTTAPIEPTGNMLVKFKKGIPTSEAVALLKSSGSSVATVSDFKASFQLGAVLDQANAFVLERLGVAVLRNNEPDEFKARQGALSLESEIAAIVPEFYVFAASDTSADDPIHFDQDDATWGVHAVGGVRSSLSGRGITVGVLDTGFDGSHPDFQDRDIAQWSAFGVPTETDPFGHGTHCVGTVAGPRRNSSRPRYGIAYEAAVRVYKVLNDGGFGTDGAVLAGIDQALADGCQVITMSFGRSAPPESHFNPIYEDVASEALDAGTVMVAAAGNAISRHQGFAAPIDYPANSPSIMAVAALDRRLDIADFSCRAVAANTSIDFAAPGWDVFSSFTMPRRYHRCHGTSTAVPHVGGVACLWAQLSPELRGWALLKAMFEHARPLPGPRCDVGAGLVYAPF